MEMNNNEKLNLWAEKAISIANQLKNESQPAFYSIIGLVIEEYCNTNHLNYLDAISDLLAIAKMVNTDS